MSSCSDKGSKLLAVAPPKPEAAQFSQWGEEETVQWIVEFLLERAGLDVNKAIFLEFGGSKGSDNSNFYFLAQGGFRTVFIEGDIDKFVHLRDSLNPFSRSTAIQAFVGTKESGTNLEALLKKEGITPTDVVGLSVDVDGDDLLLFEERGQLNPEFVIIEYNPDLPFHIPFRNPEGGNIGNSLRATAQSLEAAGFFPVALTSTNVIALNNRHAGEVQGIDLFQAFSIQQHACFGLGYDGTLVKVGSDGTNLTQEFYRGWSNTIVVQPIPKVLRGFSERRLWKSRVRALVSILQVFLLRPISGLKFVLRRVRNPNTKPMIFWRF